MKNLKNKKGITLVALVITIVVLLIIVAIVIKELNDNGIIEKAKEAKYEQEVAQIKEKIDLACNGKAIDKYIEDLTNDEFFEKIEEELKNEKEFENAIFSYGNNAEEMLMLIQLPDGKWYEYEISTSGIKNSEEVLCLDIANGCIDIYADGYKQGTGTMNGNSLTVSGEKQVTSSSKYIITGTSNQNVVRIMEAGNYDIIINNLNIDVSNISNLCAFNCNRNSITEGLSVNVELVGESTLIGGSKAPGLGFTNGTPNTGSTVTVGGTGALNASSKSGVGIGAGFTGHGYDLDSANGNANNIIINSGTIIAEAKGSMNSAIGASYRASCNNIVMNGGNITAITRNYYGIGGKTANNIIINGGNILAKGGEYGGAIGGDNGSDIIINGGKVETFNGGGKSAIGFNSPENLNEGNITINGGMITAVCLYGGGYSYYGIQSSIGNISINGGTVFALGKLGVIGKYNTGTTEWEETTPTTSNVTLKQYTIPTNNKRVIVTKVMIGEEVLYDTSLGSTATREDGKIDIYVPTGDTRTITVEANGQTYTF